MLAVGSRREQDRQPGWRDLTRSRSAGGCGRDVLARRPFGALRGCCVLGSIAAMRGSRALAIAVVGIIVILGVLMLRFRPVLPPDGTLAASASAAARAVEAAYPPASIDGRPAPDRSLRTVELCGYGPFEARYGQIYPPHLEASAELALAQAAAALATGGNARQRAGALYLQATSAWTRMRDGYVAQHAGCNADPACLTRAESAGRESFIRASEALLADAMASRDPAAYALAYYACRKRPSGTEAGGACRLVSAAQWAQLDSGNLVAWAHAAWEAQERGDADARADALRRAAQATESDMRFDALLEPLAHPNVRNLERATRSIAQGYATGIRAAVAVPGVGVLREQCVSKAPLDGERRELCTGIARVLTEHGSSMMELSLGASIGESAGWPQEEIRALRERYDAFRAVTEGELPPPWSCEFQQNLDRAVTAALSGGEVKGAADLVAASGRTTAELAQQTRDRSLARAQRQLPMQARLQSQSQPDGPPAQRPN